MTGNGRAGSGALVRPSSPWCASLELESLTEYGLPFTALMLAAAGVGVPIPQDPVLLAAGVLAGTSHNFLTALLWVELGQISGDLVAYLAGRLLPERWHKLPPLSWLLNERRSKWVRGLLEQSPWRAVIVGRQIPVLRTSLFVVAGMTRQNPARLFAIDATVFNTHTLPVLLLGMLAGGNIETIERWVEYAGNGTIVAAVVILLAWMLYRRRNKKPLPDLDGPDEGPDSSAGG